MKIGIDGRFLDPKPSGNGVFTQMLIEHLARNESLHEFVIYMSRDFDFLKQDNFELKKMHFLHRIPHFRFLHTFSKELTDSPVDIFHAIYTVPHGIPAKAVLSLIEFSWITEPDLFPTNVLLRLQLEMMTRYSIRRADRVIVPTRYVRNRLMEHFDINDDIIDVIPLGVSDFFRDRLPDDVIDEVLSRYGIEGPYLFFVGNLHPRKNIERLIRCFNQIRDERKGPLQLVLAGEKVMKYEKIMQQIEGSPYRESIRGLGYISLGDLRALYQGTHLFVFPSLQEGFGIPPLEAMASGVPIVASTASSIPDVVGDAAILFDPFDRAEMKQAILEGIDNDELRAELVGRGRERVEKFSWDNIARETLRVYEEVLSA